MKDVQLPSAILNVTEARRTLPHLVHQVSNGGPAVAIGPRGRAAAVLVDAAAYESLCRRAAAAPTAVGWKLLELERSPDAGPIDEELRRLRAERAWHLDARAVALTASEPPAGRSYRARKRRRARRP